MDLIPDVREAMDNVLDEIEKVKEWPEFSTFWSGHENHKIWSPSSKGLRMTRFLNTLTKSGHTLASDVIQVTRFLIIRSCSQKIPNVATKKSLNLVTLPQKVYHTKVDYPMAEFVLCLGFLTILIVEQVILECRTSPPSSTLTSPNRSSER